MHRELRAICLFALLTAALAASGCAKYTLLTSRSIKLEPGSKVAVAVVTPESIGESLTALEGYLTAALIGRGFSVQALRLEMIASPMMLSRLLPMDPYSAGKTLAKGMEKGGEIDADQDFVARVLERNEIADANIRLDGLVNLVKKIPELLETEYLLVVHQFDTFGYAAYLVRLSDKKISYAMVVSGNDKGFRSALGRPQLGKYRLAEEGDISRIEYLRLAEFIAGTL